MSFICQFNRLIELIWKFEFFQVSGNTKQKGLLKLEIPAFSGYDGYNVTRYVTFRAGELLVFRAPGALQWVCQ